MENIEVPNHVLIAFEEVRKSGKTNMFNSSSVLYYMNELNHHESVLWLAEVKGDKVICNRTKFISILKEIEDNHKVLNML